MSNIIKAENVVMLDQPVKVGANLRYITIQVPVFETGNTREEMKRKVLEELDELLHEFSSGPVDNGKALSEMFDVVQTVARYILADTTQSILSGQGAHDYVERRLEDANDRHIHKIHQYAQERGWRLIRHEPV